MALSDAERARRRRERKRDGVRVLRVPVDRDVPERLIADGYLAESAAYDYDAIAKALAEWLEEHCVTRDGPMLDAW